MPELCPFGGACRVADWMMLPFSTCRVAGRTTNQLQNHRNTKHVRQRDGCWPPAAECSLLSIPPSAAEDVSLVWLPPFTAFLAK